MNVLVIQPAFIGDAIISIAFAEALKSAEPSCHITYLVRPESVGLLKYAPSINSVIPYDKYGEESGRSGIESKAKALNVLGFDTVVCLHSSMRTLELVKRLNAPIKLGMVANDVFTAQIIPQIGDDQARIAVRFAEAFHRDCVSSSLPKLHFPDDLLPTDFATLSRPIIGIAPGSVWKTKRWKASHFIGLANELLEKGVSVIWIGQEKDVDAELLKSVNILKNNSINYLSKLSLEESGAVIQHLDLLISNDSAPVHIAVATGTPVIDIFGPTIPEFGFAPRAESGLSIGIENLWCRPCSSHGSNECPIHTHQCMEDIRVERILESSKQYVTISSSQ